VLLKCRASFAFFLVLTGAAGILPAQQPAGEIRLQVKDPSGAVVAASGTLRNQGGAVSRSFRTDSQGASTLSNLPYGSYRLEVGATGFATASLLIDVQSGTPVSRTVTLDVGTQSSRVNVVATTPLAGTDLATDQIAGPVQTATASDIEQSGSLALSDFMNRRMNGVYLNEMQGNPFQPDVNFRGYTASPLLGTPQGLSVYLDGVRQNQPFGDVVSWDLIPQNAISEFVLTPGSDPLFGLNTLGGAVSIKTKDGVNNPGINGTLLYGSSGRKEVQAEYGGGKATGFNWFLAGTGFHESGWRYDSPSDVRQGFARVGWRTDKTDLAVTGSYAYNTLLGNGLQDYRLLEQNYSSSYTVPDSIADRSPSVTFIARHTFSNALTFSGNAWFRNIRTEGINPNFNTDAFGNQIFQPNASEQATLTAAGYTGFPTSGANASNTPFPQWRCIANALEQNDPDERCDAVTIYSKEVQNEFGVSGQFTWITSPSLGRNQFTAGGSLDRGSINYTQNTAYGYLNPNYTITNVPAWQDGSTNNPVDSRVNLHGLTPNGSFYFTDTITLLRTLNLTVSGRYNRETVDNSDRINPVAGPGSLTANYVFQRFNPSVGLTWSPYSWLNAYARFSQGSRAPTSIELGCADPANPCSLPNALASDPPLNQVVTDTWEAGLRGKPESFAWAKNLSWNIGAFRADNHDDILFVNSAILGTGYFQNFGETRREGVYASLAGTIGRINFGFDYTFLSATYQNAGVLDGGANNTSDSALAGYPGLDGNIYINPGNRIPLIPKQSGKAYMEIRATSRLMFNLNEVIASSEYARGNENNAYQADGVYYLGPGVVPGYAITNVRAHYDVTKHIQLAVEIDNLFDHHYYTAGQLANTGLTAQGTVTTRPFPAYTTGPFAGSYPAQSVIFFSPGAPLRAWVELGLKF
jgi:outer membrane receptor protein involved in Fe transport